MARLSFATLAAILAIVPQVYSSGCNVNDVLRALRRYSMQAARFCATFIQETQTVTVMPSTQLVNTVYVTQTVVAGTATDYTSTIPTQTVTASTTNNYDIDGIPGFPFDKRAVAAVSSYIRLPVSGIEGQQRLFVPGWCRHFYCDGYCYSLYQHIDNERHVVQTVDATLDVTVTNTLSSSTLTTLALATQIVVCGVCVSGDQVVQNAGFEQVDSSGAPTVWTTYAQKYASISDVTSFYAVNGKRLILATETDTSPFYPRVILTQFLTVCPTATYTLPFYAGIYNPNGGYVTSQNEVQLDGTVVLAKVAPCSSGTGGNCDHAAGSTYYWRKLTVSGIAPTTATQSWFSEFISQRRRKELLTFRVR